MLQQLDNSQDVVTFPDHQQSYHDLLRQLTGRCHVSWPPTELPRPPQL